MKIMPVGDTGADPENFSKGGPTFSIRKNPLHTPEY